jgi:transcription initiation factor TFIID subunit TAF12
MKRNRAIQNCQTRAAAMANATRGKKTWFPSRVDVLNRLGQKQALEEIAEAKGSEHV